MLLKSDIKYSKRSDWAFLSWFLSGFPKSCLKFFSEKANFRACA